MRVKPGMFVVFLIIIAVVAIFVRAAVISDNTNVAVPTTNGTSSNTSITGLAEQLVGFYGNVTVQVRNNSAAGNILYQKPVTTGVLYFLKTGQAFPNAVVNATANTTADGVIGFTGFYASSNVFDSRQDACGETNVSKLNTTDNRMTGLLSNNTNDQYFFCTDIGSFTSANGFGTIGYEIIVPKTLTYTSYDIWFDLT